MSIERSDDINQLHPKVKELAERLLVEAKKQGLDVKIIDTYRSKERQDYLYAQGRARPGQIVTNAKGSDMASYHNWRLAFDCIQNKKGAEYDSSFLSKLGSIGKSLGLEWGGGWSSFKDAPHFQYTFGLTIKQLKEGKKPPVYKAQDTELVQAVNKIIASGVSINASAWNDLSRINLNNVPALINKIGGLDKLVKDKVISSKTLWEAKEYNANHVKALLIKYAAHLG